MLGFLMIWMLILVPSSVAMTLFDTLEVGEESEIIPIHVHEMPEPIDITKKLSPDRGQKSDFLPKHLAINFKCRGSPMFLNLIMDRDNLREKIDGDTATGDDIPMFTTTEATGKVHLDNFPRLFSKSCMTFVDRESSAAFMVIRDPAFSSFKFMGSFFMNNTHYFVQPYSDVSSGIGQRLHVSTETPNVDFNGDHGSFLTQMVQKSRDNLRKKRSLLRNPTRGDLMIPQTGVTLPGFKDSLREDRKKRAVQRYTIEVMFVCDYLCYIKFQNQLNITSEVETKNSVTLFFSYIRSFLDVAYSSVVDRDSEIDIRITIPGIYLASKPDIHVIGRYRLAGIKIPSGASLFEFAVWVQDNLASTQKADHYALFTGFDLHGSRYRPEVVGQVTRIGSVCGIDSVSVNEAQFDIAAQVFAHELGHSLGAEHDGLTSLRCRDSDQFIMANFVGPPTRPSNRDNLNRFSVCSVDFFKRTLPNKRCVQRRNFNFTAETSSSPASQSSISSSTNLLGQQYGPDKQCQLAFGPSSRVCREILASSSPRSWDRMSSDIPCLLPHSDSDCDVISSLEFTTCGNKRWSQGGVCMDHPDAPATKVDCPIGDNPETVCDVDMCMDYDETKRFVLCCDTCEPIKTERFIL